SASSARKRRRTTPSPVTRSSMAEPLSPYVGLVRCAGRGLIGGQPGADPRVPVGAPLDASRPQHALHPEPRTQRHATGSVVPEVGPPLDPVQTQALERPV